MPFTGLTLSTLVGLEEILSHSSLWGIWNDRDDETKKLDSRKIIEAIDRKLICKCESEEIAVAICLMHNFFKENLNDIRELIRKKNASDPLRFDESIDRTFG